MLLRSIKKALQSTADHAASVAGPQHRGSGHPRIWILMYHRILPETDPRYVLEEPGMVVKPDTFRMHLDVVSRYFKIFPLGEWLERRNNGQALPPKSCAITFDDGWRDNYDYAFPILKETQFPVTLFAVSHMIGTARNFWPNRVSRLLGESPEYLKSIPWLAPHLDTSGPGTPDRDQRSAIIESLKIHPDQQISEWLDKMDPHLNAPPALMNWDQLREMTSSGLVDVGSHTCSHCRLDAHIDPALIRREVRDSKIRLQEQLSRPVRLFCYPNGDYDADAVRAVGEHYDAAVTTHRGINSASKLKPYELLRIGIHEERCSTEARFASRLACWY